MSIEAMKQALEALVTHGSPWLRHEKQYTDAIASLRQAIDKAEKREPVAWQGCDLDGMVEAFERVIEAHFFRKNPFHNPIDADAQMALRILRGFIPYMKQYTSPPQREWVGLTPADFDWLEQVFANKVSNDFVFADIVCVISAKLKEKNT